MERFFEHINILVIPTNACNLRCEYCFHNEYVSNVDNARMSTQVLEQIFRITFPFYKSVNIIWHGGEPLCMGLDFYKEVIRLQNKYRTEGMNVINSIQTNMTLMTPEIAKFFKENHFNVSTSYDGVKNEMLRHNTEVFLKKKKIYEDNAGKCGMIMVVSKANIDYLIASYEEFKLNRTNYIMNPYTKSLYDGRDDLEISGNEYAKKMIQFYDYWVHDQECNIYVKYFHEIIDYILFGNKSKCNVNSCLGKWICVRPDGVATPCNRYFPDEYNFGNILDMQDLGEAFESEGFKLLLTQAIERRYKCKECSIYDYCTGGCNNVALVYGGVEKNNHEMCIALKIIYDYIERSIRKIIDQNIEDINPLLVKIIRRYRDTKGICVDN